MSETRDPGERVDGQADEMAPAGLDAGGHEPAPPSEDPAEDEARDSIQDAFDDLQAMHPGDDIWEQATRRADEAPAADPSTAANGEQAGKP